MVLCSLKSKLSQLHAYKDYIEYTFSSVSKLQSVLSKQVRLDFRDISPSSSNIVFLSSIFPKLRDVSCEGCIRKNGSQYC